MKIIYYNKKIFINKNNISAYNLILNCLEKIKDKPKNIDHYYLTSLEGHPLKYSQIVKQNETYYLKNRLKGSTNLNNPGNSTPLMIFSGIVFAVVSVSYYWIYTKIILGGVNPILQSKLSSFAVTDMKKYKQTKFEGGAVPANTGKKTFKEKVNCVLCCIGDWIDNNLRDTNVGQYFCYTRGMMPYFTTKDDEGSIASTFSSVLFFLYMFMVIISMFSNMATSAACKNPNPGFIILAMVFLAIPIIIAIFIPNITTALDNLMKKLGRCEVFNKFKLLTANILLLILLFFYMGVNKKGISPALWGMMIPMIIVFTLFHYKIPGADFSIDSLISQISTKISNMIVTTTEYNIVPENPNGIKVSPMNNKANPIPPDYSQNEIKNKKIPMKETREGLYLRNIRECFDRFELFFFIIKSILFTLIGASAMSFVFGSQLRTACKKK